MMKIVSAILGLLALIGVVFGVHEYFEKTYASREAWAQTDKKVEKAQNALEIHKLEDYLRSLKVRIWDAESQLRKNPKDEKTKRELPPLLDEKKTVEDQILDLRKK